MIGRRAFLTGASAAAAYASLGGASPLLAATAGPTEYFVLIHASGGWDVTLWADPRVEKTGAVQPATTANQQTAGVRLWADAPFDAEAKTFRPVVPKGRAVQLGPAVGDLLDLFDRVTILNGVAMSTVAHPDGAAFASTGRHLVGGRPVASSIDAVLGHSFGVAQMLPVVSIQFPSAYLAGRLDPRAIPIEVAGVESLGQSLARRDIVTWKDDRDDVSSVLHTEAQRAIDRTTYAQRFTAISSQYDALGRLVKEGVEGLVGVNGLHKAHPNLPWSSRAGNASLSAAFAIEAMRRDLARVVAFSMSGFDTHATNYRFHALTLQDFFQMFVTMVKAFDEAPHPTLSGHKLSDHVHFLVFSEFCRTPQINVNGGRDHYPNNSMLILSPKIRGGVVVGRSDPGELLPIPERRFALGQRAVAPPDVLATFLSAVKVDPAPYIRDGEVLRDLLV
jgi:hypothetical protein